MQIKNNLPNKINATLQSKWIHPALMTLALLVTVLVANGCTPHH